MVESGDVERPSGSFVDRRRASAVSAASSVAGGFTAGRGPSGFRNPVHIVPWHRRDWRRVRAVDRGSGASAHG